MNGFSGALKGVRGEGRRDEMRGINMYRGLSRLLICAAHCSYYFAQHRTLRIVVAQRRKVIKSIKEKKRRGRQITKGYLTQA